VIMRSLIYVIPIDISQRLCLKERLTRPRYSMPSFRHPRDILAHFQKIVKELSLRSTTFRLFLDWEKKLRCITIIFVSHI
jgi:hypothetical protein